MRDDRAAGGAAHGRDVPDRRAAVGGRRRSASASGWAASTPPTSAARSWARCWRVRARARVRRAHEPDAAGVPPTSSSASRMLMVVSARGRAARRRVALGAVAPSPGARPPAAARRRLPRALSRSCSWSPTGKGWRTRSAWAASPTACSALFTNSRSQTNDAPRPGALPPRDGPPGGGAEPARRRRARSWSALGGGATPGAIAQHSGAEIDLIELSEAVVAAAPHFSVANQDVLASPTCTCQIDDGRNFLLRNRAPVRRDHRRRRAAVRRRRDQPVLGRVLHAGVARALAPDGIMVQWASPGSAYEHELIVRSFLQVFPARFAMAHRRPARRFA